jgi:hypothetical protein
VEFFGDNIVAKLDGRVPWVGIHTIFLESKFGDEFRAWAAKIPIIIPRFKNYKPPKLPFSWKVAVKREFNGLFGIIGIFFVLDILGDRAAVSGAPRKQIYMRQAPVKFSTSMEVGKEYLWIVQLCLAPSGDPIPMMFMYLAIMVSYFITMEKPGASFQRRRITISMQFGEFRKPVFMQSGKIVQLLTMME